MKRYVLASLILHGVACLLFLVMTIEQPTRKPPTESPFVYAQLVTPPGSNDDTAATATEEDFGENQEEEEPAGGALEALAMDEGEGVPQNPPEKAATPPEPSEQDDSTDDPPLAAAAEGSEEKDARNDGGPIVLNSETLERKAWRNGRPAVERPRLPAQRVEGTWEVTLKTHCGDRSSTSILEVKEGRDGKLHGIFINPWNDQRKPVKCQILGDELRMLIPERSGEGSEPFLVCAKLQRDGTIKGLHSADSRGTGEALLAPRSEGDAARLGASKYNPVGTWKLKAQGAWIGGWSEAMLPIPYATIEICRDGEGGYKAIFIDPEDGWFPQEKVQANIPKCKIQGDLVTLYVEVDRGGLFMAKGNFKNADVLQGGWVRVDPPPDDVSGGMCGRWLADRTSARRIPRRNEPESTRDGDLPRQHAEDREPAFTQASIDLKECQERLAERRILRDCVAPLGL